MDSETEKETNIEAKKEMKQIIAELKQKMNEIDEITKELTKKREEIKKQKADPKKTQKILEQIDVPPLELLK